MTAWPTPPDPIDALRADIEHLEDIFGLYVAGPLADRLAELDPDQDDADDADEQTALWICRLTRAMQRLSLGSRIAFHPDTIGERQDAAEADVRRATTQGERMGRVRGAADERAARIEADGSEPEIRAALRRVGGKARPAEPWERALW